MKKPSKKTKQIRRSIKKKSKKKGNLKAVSAKSSRMFFDFVLILFVFAVGVLAFVLISQSSFSPKSGETSVFGIKIGAFISNTNISGLKPKEVERECKFIPREKLYAPILMYHHIDTSRFHNPYYVTTDMFDKQMGWLMDYGYNVISFDKFYEAVSCGWDLPPNPVLITFDDGDLDNFENALPILIKFGYQATFFIPTSYLKDYIHMKWPMVEDLNYNGMTIGSHTLTHANVIAISDYWLDWELKESKRLLEEHIGEPVKFFAYPGGSFSKHAAEHVRDAGYKAAVTTRRSAYQNILTMDDFFFLNRIHVDNDLESFAKLIQN